MLNAKMLKLIMLLIASVCLLSFPVLSGENPWDADDGPGGGSDGSADPDSMDVIITPDELIGINRVADQGDWYDGLIINTSIYLYNWIYGDFDLKDNNRINQERGSRISHKLR